jgi:hypothetical protein
MPLYWIPNMQNAIVLKYIVKYMNEIVFTIYRVLLGAWYRWCILATVLPFSRMKHWGAGSSYNGDKVDTTMVFYY